MEAGYEGRTGRTGRIQRALCAASGFAGGVRADDTHRPASSQAR
ncbi:hypothetical protein LMG27174_03887 [Paraburkholderia rhynchosiae]|uniref:Uncharacterized protein n=1 Tax=Paraburkholderia rhynchosiae TaxID=487049 RepID=A0A6J5BG32_9BURK|nr:hypothetical protein LMG27174_03887 [Paraburkholderia rhynchosiae]